MSDYNGLLYERKNPRDTMTESDLAAMEAYCDEYKRYLDNAKTEREAVSEAVRLASMHGFAPYTGGSVKAGDRIFRVLDGKAAIFAVIGIAPLTRGVNIAAAHVDSPRLDLKQVPLYEDGDLAFFKTHYYGGIKKYQWLARPLSLHGVVIKKDGTAVNIVIGEDDNDPILMITDLLPHLGKDQMKKTLSEAFTGEHLNILIGSVPTGDEKDKDCVRRGIMNILAERYGIVEEDFVSAELEAVPNMNARDMGLDRSMIAGYGHDDRACAFAALRAILEIGTPETTAVCVLADKEEVGSDGVSGMQSAAFDDFMADLCDAAGVKLRECYARSFCLSGDNCNAFDPNFADVSEKANGAKLGYGLGILKFTGSGGKSGSSDASAETVAEVRRIFSENSVVWQMTELGKVDQGGGGTVAKYMANRNIRTIDAGVPTLSMHAPYEIVAKLDCYMTYKGIFAIYENRQAGNS